MTTDDNVARVRSAYEAYERGDVAAVLDLVDEDFEWTYLDPAFEDPEPQVCHGRDELAAGLGRMERHGLRPQLEEIGGTGDKVMVIVRTPGLDATRARKADDRNFEVLTLRAGRIVAMRACRNRVEASSSPACPKRRDLRTHSATMLLMPFREARCECAGDNPRSAERFEHDGGR